MPAERPRHRIGEAARLSGVPAATIRYYEKEALLQAQAREGNQYRLYTDDEVHRLRFIRLCRAMDMSLVEVRTLLALDLDDPADCARASDALTAHLGHVQERLQELQALEQDLTALRDRCSGHGGRCGIIETLHARADAQPPVDLTAPGVRRHV